VVNDLSSHAAGRGMSGNVRELCALGVKGIRTPVRADGRRRSELVDRIAGATVMANHL
jgi:hypothetical protein